MLRAIVELSRCGCPPTIREIAGEIGVNATQTVQRHVDKLRYAGYLRGGEGKARSIVVEYQKAVADGILEPQSRYEKMKSAWEQATETERLEFVRRVTANAN